MSVVHLLIDSERRGSPRYPLDASVRFRLSSQPKGEPPHQGRVVDMSSSGLLFTTPVSLKVNAIVRIEIDWPMRLANRLPLVLRIRGKVVRSGRGLAAITIAHREFRTRNPPALEVVEPQHQRAAG